MAAQQLPPAARFGIIRIALAMGVLTFGGVVYAMQAQGMLPAPAPEQTTMLRYAAYGVWGVVLAAMVILRSTQERRIERGEPMPLLIGWALGEAAAIFGAAYWFLTGTPSLYFGGLAVFAAAFVLFPLPRR
jgi:hypothetical protein